MKKLRDLGGKLAHIYLVQHFYYQAGIMAHKFKTAVFLIGGMVILGACASVKNIKIPNFDSIKLPEFKQEAENIGGYIKTSEIPDKPEGVRSASEWDKSANKLIKARDSLTVPTDGAPAKTEAEIETRNAGVTGEGR